MEREKEMRMGKELCAFAAFIYILANLHWAWVGLVF